MLEAFSGVISLFIELGFFVVPILAIWLVATIVRKVRLARAMKQAKVFHDYVDSLFFLDYGEGVKFYEMGE